MEYPRQGVLPEAMVNFLALLGWSPGAGDEEVFTRDQLIVRFSLEGISGGNAVFNPEKLEWFNHQHIARLASHELIARLEPVLRSAGFWQESFTSERRPWLEAVLELLRPRARKLQDFVEKGRIFFADAIDYDEAAVGKHLTPEIAPNLEALVDAYEGLPEFAREPLEANLRGVAEARHVKPATLIHAVRVAVTGSTVSPGLFETLELLGRQRALARLHGAAGRGQAAAHPRR
jgi:glutamyl-tRNA synthetase